MATQVTHLDASFGLSSRTACGRSTHSYNPHAPKNVTTTPALVSCKRCYDKGIKKK